MSPFEKIHDGFFEHIGTAVAVAVVGLVGWICFAIAPLAIPAVESSLAPRTLLAILGLSLFLNVALSVAVWRLTSKPTELRLKYGVLWDKDKNPHCPICKNGGLDYDEWTYRLGYLCKSCDKVFPLKDSSGNDVKPVDAIASL